MKLIAFLAAGLVAAAAAPVPAVAQMHSSTRVVVHQSTTTRHVGPQRGHVRKVCTMRRSHGHMVRRCRTVRTR